jgi:heat shock protein HslJ
MRALILAVLLSGCSLLGGATSPSLNGEWQLQAGTDQGHPIPIAPGSTITLTIDGTRVGGSSACNIYGGTIELSGASVSISALSMTEMACQEDRMASEAAYLAALPRVRTASRSGDSLVLSGPNVELSYVLVPPVANADLVGTAWTLESLASGDAVSSIVAEATLQLNADGTLSASTGCRHLTGRYAVSGAKVTGTLDPYDTIGCVNPIGDQDAHILQVIGGEFSFAIQGESLTLTAGDKGLGYRAVSAD